MQLNHASVARSIHCRLEPLHYSYQKVQRRLEYFIGLVNPLAVKPSRYFFNSSRKHFTCPILVYSQAVSKASISAEVLALLNNAASIQHCNEISLRFERGLK